MGKKNVEKEQLQELQLQIGLQGELSQKGTSERRREDSEGMSHAEVWRIEVPVGGRAIANALRWAGWLEWREKWGASRRGSQKIPFEADGMNAVPCVRTLAVTLSDRGVTAEF